MLCIKAMLYSTVATWSPLRKQLSVLTSLNLCKVLFNAWCCWKGTPQHWCEPCCKLVVPANSLKFMKRLF